MEKKLFGTPLRILRSTDIISAVSLGYLQISPFNKKKVQPTSYDIGISQIIRFTEQKTYSGDSIEEIIEDFDELLISPGSSFLFLSEERFSFPDDMLARIGLRSRYSRLFNTGEYMGRIECGWSGRLVLEISNRSVTRVIRVVKGEALATLEIFQLEESVSNTYSGKYMNWPERRK